MYSNQAMLEAVMKYDLTAVEEMLKANLREETASARGSRKGYKIVESMIKKTNERPEFKMAHKFGDKFAFLDGHRLFVADNDLGYENAVVPFNVANMFPKSTEDFTEVEIDYSELTYFIKVWGKKLKPYFFKAGNKIIGINPKYLKDAIDYSGSNKILVMGKKTPIYTSDMKCIVLPVNQEVDYSEWYKNHIAA